MNIKEIAQLAGVSISTVSKIINHKDENIRAETRERVLKIVKQYNYIPYASTVPSSQKTWTIGILFNTAEHFTPILTGIMKTAQENGYCTIILNSFQEHTQELRNITTLCNKNIDAVLWNPIDEESLTYSHHFENINIPYIIIHPELQNSGEQLPYASTGYYLTKELIDRKHTTIACLYADSSNGTLFYNGYKKCLFEHHIPFHENFLFKEVNENFAYYMNLHKISGVICSEYSLALKFYKMMDSLHYRIPNDISLISLDFNEEQEQLFPEISTCTISLKDYGHYICKKLLKKIEKKDEQMPPFSQPLFLNHTSTLTLPSHLNQKKILVVGSINIDTYLNVPHLPNSRRTVSTSVSSIYPGGKGMNQAIGASKLGHPVTLLGNIGTDLDSDRVYQALNEYHIDSIGVNRCKHSDTGKAYIFVAPNGESMISILSGANNFFTAETIQKKEHLFENTGYCLVQTEIPMEVVIEACRLAHKYNSKTILKPSTCKCLSEELIHNVDILVPNEEELSELCPQCLTLEERAKYLFDSGVETIIVTLGERGCYVHTKQWQKYFPASHFASIDTTGASDAFISALTSYLLYGYSLEHAVEIANYAAGFCISREGVVPALIDKNSLESYVNQYCMGLIKK